MSTAIQTASGKVTTRTLLKMKAEGKKIAMLTAYDYSLAGLLDQTGIDAILVGDSAANVMAGYPTTLPMTLDQMIYHGVSVVRAVSHALVIVDMPFGFYQGDPLEALRSAVRIMKETGADAVKLEGGEEVAESIQKIISAGIPVMGHLGLTPQSINKFGTYSVRATSDTEAKKLIQDAKLLEELGCFGFSVKIPTIGIGAGNQTDGQVLVLHDMLGITQGFSPRYLRRYHNLGTEITEAISRYIEDVKTSAFPNDKEQY